MTLAGMDPKQFCLCAKCGKPVEEIVTFRDDILMRIEVELRCHGQIHTLYLSDRDTLAANAIRGVPTYFFMPINQLMDKKS
jgi:hypothetical protein